MHRLFEKPSIDSIYSFLNLTFCIIVVISNIISSKMVTLPFFHDLNIPAGLITYPLTFFLSDLVTEIYGAKKARSMVFQAFAMSLVSYLIIKMALVLPSPSQENYHHFEEILGLNGIILLGSLSAYIVSQTIDIQLYAFLKKKIGSKHLWIRNNGSTLAAQLIDTLILNIIFLKIGVGMRMSEVLPIMTFSYLYKCTFSIFLTPLFYYLVLQLKKIVLRQYTQTI